MPNDIGDFGLNRIDGHGFLPKGIEDFGLDHLGKHGFGAERHQGF